VLLNGSDDFQGDFTVKGPVPLVVSKLMNAVIAFGAIGGKTAVLTDTHPWIGAADGAELVGNTG